MDSILNDWKHLLRTETSQKSLLKVFSMKTFTRKVKDFQKLSPDIWGKTFTNLFIKML